MQVWRKVGTNWIVAGSPVTAGGTAGGDRTVILTGWSTFSDFALSNSDAPLPVKFGTVKATQKANGILVEWGNLTETDVVSYSVECSADGSRFTAITQLNAKANNGGKADYSFLDANPNKGVNFYRISALETSGKKVYSVVVKVVAATGKNTVVVYPNPAQANSISFFATKLQQGMYMIRITNNAGQEVYRQSFNHSGGAVSQSLALPEGLAKGVYNLQISSNTERIVKTFVVQ